VWGSGCRNRFLGECCAEFGTAFTIKRDSESGQEEATEIAAFTLAQSLFVAMDGCGAHNFGFNEAVSIVIEVETQEEIDFLCETGKFTPAHGNAISPSASAASSRNSYATETRQDF
jgi:hypothetical protein